MNDDVPTDLELLEQDFDERVSVVLREIMPDLVNRAERADFAKWYRIRGQIEDLVQETAFRFFSHCKKHRIIPEDPLAYAVRIAQNIVKREAKMAKRRPLDLTGDEQVEAIPDRPEPNEKEDRIVYSASQLERLRIAVDMLPKGQRRVFELRNANPGSTDKELGLILGIGEDGFRKQCQRAFDRITLYLKEEI